MRNSCFGYVGGTDCGGGGLLCTPLVHPLYVGRSL